MRIKKGDIFTYKGNEYIYLGEILNKTTNKQMVIYSANGVDYVREKEDFFRKFKSKEQ